MRLHKLLASAGFEQGDVARFSDREVTGIVSDFRTFEVGNIFVAIRGLRYDGSTCIAEAIARGASLVLCECPFDDPRVMRVENARASLACLLDAWYDHPSRHLHLIGITGTNGKTSTAAMLFHVLRQTGHSCGLIGTVECRFNDRVLTARGRDPLANMTTPDPDVLYDLLSQMHRLGARYVVMEVTSHALFFSKVAPLRFVRGVFTNLTADHLDLHGDMESYFLEKRKLFDACEGAVISCSTPYGTRLADSLEIPLWRVDDRVVSEVTLQGLDGIDFTLRAPCEGRCAVHLPVAGEFMTENGALAAMTAISLGIPASAVTAALSRFPGVRGRMERVLSDASKPTVLLDYAHTPDALEKLLRSVRACMGEQNRLTVVFGCGGDRDRSKRAEMGRIASRLADLTVLTSDNCRNERPEDILRDVLKGIDKEKPYRVIPDRRAAIRYAVKTARAGDAVVLAGKGHETYEIRGGERLEFSEREIVEACFAEGEKGG